MPSSLQPWNCPPVCLCSVTHPLRTTWLKQFKFIAYKNVVNFSCPFFKYNLTKSCWRFNFRNSIFSHCTYRDTQTQVYSLHSIAHQPYPLPTVPSCSDWLIHTDWLIDWLLSDWLIDWFSKSQLLLRLKKYPYNSALLVWFHRGWLSVG